MSNAQNKPNAPAKPPIDTTDATTPPAAPPAPEGTKSKAATTPATKKERKYEVVVQINLGAGRLHANGSTVSESQLRDGGCSAKEIAGFVATGILRDGDAPIPPSQAEGHVAFERLASIAIKTEVVSRDGGTYRFGAREIQGLDAFRAAVSLDELEAAIVAAFEARNQ